MIYQVIADVEATREWNEAVDWYESQEPGVGLRFDDALRGFLETLANDPDRFPPVKRLSRRAKLPKPWPYSVYFTVNRGFQEVKVLAVWHAARNPTDLKHRLR